MRSCFVALLVGACAVMSIRPSAARAGSLKVCLQGCPYSSIQSAIDAAQTGDTIKVGRGTYAENLHIQLPVAARTLTLRGIGARGTIVDGNRQDCVLQVDKGYTVTIRRMTFTNGRCLSAGGIVNDGALTLTKVIVTRNEGEETAGGIANDIDGTLTLIHTAVTYNQSTDQTSGRGGGIFNLGTASLIKTTVTGNSAPVFGGGIENEGHLLADHLRIDNNMTQGLGGGLETHSGGEGNATVTLRKTFIRGNTAFGGGGISVGDGIISMNSSPVLNNSADTGGGLFNSPGGTAVLNSSPVIGNHASVDGGGIANDRGTLKLSSSPVNDNRAASSSGGSKGGGLALFGGTAQLNSSPVINNTVNGPSGGLGGGIVITDDGSLTLISRPVFHNTAGTDGGGIYVFSGSVSFRKAPVRFNHPDQCVNVPGC
jgi:hypothetical protein